MEGDKIKENKKEENNMEGLELELEINRFKHAVSCLVDKVKLFIIYINNIFI
jgi:hypothetical protein